MPQISFWVENEQLQKIEKAADQNYLSVSSFCRMKILESLEDRLPPEDTLL